MDHPFLFSLLEDKPRLTSRRVHLRRLYDVLHLSLQRHDMERARRAWAILARCNEVNWKTLWPLSVGLLDHQDDTTESSPIKIDYLRSMMLQHPEQREEILGELVHHFISASRHRDALDELEFCLPSFPYRDNPTLHLYAGLCCMFHAQPSSGILGVNDREHVDSNMIDRAQIFFERAKALDPDNIVVDSLVTMAQRLGQTPSHAEYHESDDENERDPQAKRKRT